MTVARSIRNQAQTMKGRIMQEFNNDRVSGSLKQAVEKTKDAFRRNGSGPR